MKKIVVLEANGSNKNPSEVIWELYRKGNNVSIRSINENVSHIYTVGGHNDNIDRFISLLEDEGLKIVSIKVVRNNTPVDADALLKIEARSIIPT